MILKTPIDTSRSLNIEKRNVLANLLAEAAEFEHSVMCLYLFAAVSLKKRQSEDVTYGQLEMIRRWEATILMVARQEMGHMVIVNNLLTAIGESANLKRMGHPFRSPYASIDVSFSMVRFTAETLKQFLIIEMPAMLSSEKLNSIKSIISDFDINLYNGASLIYQKIKSLFAEIPDSLLFLGPSDAQFTTDDIVPTNTILGVNLRGVPKYDISISAVTDKKSALASINQIIEEGEGSGEDRKDSHFARFLEMYKELTAEVKADPSFDPARPVVSNPKTTTSYFTDLNTASKIHVIDHPLTKQVSALFDLVYETQILLLQRYFLHSDETPEELATLQYAAFFPMMTAMVRPLAEILTELPAFEDTSQTGTAGPSFSFTRRLRSLPHKEVAWQILCMQLQLMAELATNLCKLEGFPQPILERLKMIQENMIRTSVIFKERLKLACL